MSFAPLGLLSLLLILGATAASAQGWEADPDLVRRSAGNPGGFNYDESRVPEFTLPDPLMPSGGARITSPAQWQPRRAEILELFREHVYGRRPGTPEALRFELLEEDAAAMGGAATLKRVAIHSRQEGRDHTFELTLFLPNAAQGPAPVFLLLNNRPLTNTDASLKDTSAILQTVLGTVNNVSGLLIDANDPETMNRPDAPDPTAWGLHGAVHRNCRHARCVMHVHSVHATVLASLADSVLPPIDQNSAVTSASSETICALRPCSRAWRMMRPPSVW